MTPANRTTVVTWEDPKIGLAEMPKLDGTQYLRKMASGELPGPPISNHLNMTLTEVDEGQVTFRCQPDESHSNPIGMIHGGLACTLLDSALGCAAHSLLPAGTGYTSIELKVNYLRPIHADGGRLTCTGWVTKPGRRVTFAEGEIRDEAGKTVATASGSLLLFPL